MASSERRLPEQGVTGQTRAVFIDLYTREYPRIVAYAQRRTGERHSAEDIAADVFRIAWEGIAGGVPSTAWLFVTARNLLHAHHRVNQRSLRLRHRLQSEHAPAAGEPAMATDKVLTALDRLPADQRELLIAYYWDDLSGADCAALTGCSVATVWVRLHRARAALRRRLDLEEN